MKKHLEPTAPELANALVLCTNLRILVLPIKGALAKAETACTSANGNSGIGSPAEFLLPRVQHARKRLEVEKAVEALHRATTSCKSVADLAKLEAMILAARSVQIHTSQSHLFSKRIVDSIIMDIASS